MSDIIISTSDVVFPMSFVVFEVFGHTVSVEHENLALHYSGNELHTADLRHVLLFYATIRELYRKAIKSPHSLAYYVKP